MKHIYAKAARLREWLGWFAARYPQHCYICGEPIDPFAFQVGNADDGITLHHIEHDRSKNEANDVAVVHRGCHKSYHRNFVEHNRNIRTLKAIEIWGPTPEK